MSSQTAILTRRWPQETVTVPGDVGAFCSLAFDSQLRPHIACWRNPDSSQPQLLFIGQGPGGNWEAEVVRTGAGSGCALVLDSDGQPWIAFFELEANAMSVAHRVDGSWKIEQAPANLDGLSATTLALAVDASGAPAVCFSEDRGLRFARRSFGGTWTLETIDIHATAVLSCSLAFGSGDVLHVTYCDPFINGMRVATRTGEQWTPREISGTASAEFTSVAADRQGSVHAVFWSLESGLRYVRIADGAPSPELVTDDTGAGMFASVGVDRAGRPQIGYYNAESARLEFAVRTDDGWQHRTVDDSSDTGGYASLFIDSANSAHIAYYDWRARVLRVADSNRAPRPLPKQFSTFVNVPVSGTLFNADVDPDQDPVTAETTPVRSPAHGTVTIQPDGNFIYTPEEGFSGNDAFTFQVTDSSGAFGTAVVSIDVQIPVIGPEFFSLRPKPSTVIAVKVEVHTVSAAPDKIEVVVERQQGSGFIETSHRGRLPNLIIAPNTDEFSTNGYRISYRVPAKNYVLARSALFDMPASDGENDLIIGGSLERFDGPLR